MVIWSKIPFVGRSLLAKIILLVTLLLIVSVGTTTVITVAQQTKVLTKGLIEKNKLLAQQISASVKSAFWSANWFAVEAMINRSVKSDEVLHCMVVKPNGEIFLANDKSLYGERVPYNHALKAKELLVMEDVLPETGERIAVIVNPFNVGFEEKWIVCIGVSLKPIGKARKDIIYSSIYQSVLIILFGVVISFWISKEITTPVWQLVEATKEVSKGDLEHQINVTTYDEIGDLAVTFNQMTKELKRAHDELERRVKERTAELVKANEKLQAEITERKQAEEKLKYYAAELERSNQELEQFAYIASHDLQEPLRMVASYTQLLARRYKGKLDSDADEFIAYAVDGATRMKALINGLLRYSRVGTKGKDFEPTDCEAVFDRTLDNLQKAIEESGAKVTHDPLPTVMADDMQLGQLFQNLISNAIKFRSEEHPSIHVSCERIEESAIGNRQSAMNKGWVFTFRDNGIGIDPKFTGRIFIIFQRLHKREEYPGTGIGLAVCKKIVERHSGRIWVESDPGKGSTFYFTIPLRGENSHG